MLPFTDKPKIANIGPISAIAISAAHGRIYCQGDHASSYSAIHNAAHHTTIQTTKSGTLTTLNSLEIFIADNFNNDLNIIGLNF